MMIQADARERAVQILALMESRDANRLERARQQGRDIHRHLGLADGDREAARKALIQIHEIERAECPEHLHDELARYHEAEMGGFMVGFPEDP